MQQSRTEKDNKTKLLENIGNFLEKYRKVFIIAISIIAILIVGLIVFIEIRNHRSNKSAALIENVQEDYDTWVTMEDEEGKAELGKDMLSSLDSIINEYPNLYAGQRALFLRGSYYFQTDSWEEAEEDFMNLYDRFPKSYLAAISLFNAAAAAENRGDPTAAAERYRIIPDRYSDNALSPYALFSFGRINETDDDYAFAVETYNELIDSYPGSSWTKLAQDRIIEINTKGILNKEE